MYLNLDVKKVIVITWIFYIEKVRTEAIVTSLLKIRVFLL